MMKNNRILLILLTILTLALVACGGTETNTAVSDPAEIDITALGDEVDVKTVANIKDRDDVIVLDVREQWEYDEGHIPNVTLIPMGEVPDRLDEIPTDKEVVVTCRSGNRSGQIAEFLRQQGYTNIHNMTGGIVEWEAAGLPVE